MSRWQILGGSCFSRGRPFPPLGDAGAITVKLAIEEHRTGRGLSPRTRLGISPERNLPVLQGLPVNLNNPGVDALGTGGASLRLPTIQLPAEANPGPPDNPEQA